MINAVKIDLLSWNKELDKRRVRLTSERKIFKNRQQLKAENGKNMPLRSDPIWVEVSKLDQYHIV